MKTPMHALSATLLAAASIALLLVPAPAFAGEARASGGGAMFTGPSLDFPEVGSVTNGESYEVTLCTDDLSWCQVVGNGGTEGWLPGGNLVGSAAKIDARQWNLTPKDYWNPFN